MVMNITNCKRLWQQQRLSHIVNNSWFRKNAIVLKTFFKFMNRSALSACDQWHVQCSSMDSSVAENLFIAHTLHSGFLYKRDHDVGLYNDFQDINNWNWLFFIFGAFSVKAWRKNGESLVTIGTSLATDLASLDLLMRLSSACWQLVVSNLNWSFFNVMLICFDLSSINFVWDFGDSPEKHSSIF